MDTCDVIPQNKVRILERSLEKILEGQIRFLIEGRVGKRDDFICRLNKYLEITCFCQK